MGRGWLIVEKLADQDCLLWYGDDSLMVQLNISSVRLACVGLLFIRIFDLGILSGYRIGVLGGGNITMRYVSVFMVAAMACRFVPKYRMRL